MRLFAASDCLLRVPRGRHLALRVAGAQQTEELGTTVLLEVLVGHREESSAAIERIGLSSAMSHRLVLRAPAALVELGVGELDEMERICDLGGVGEHLVEHG